MVSGYQARSLGTCLFFTTFHLTYCESNPSPNPRETPLRSAQAPAGRSGRCWRRRTGLPGPAVPRRCRRWQVYPSYAKLSIPPRADLGRVITITILLGLGRIGVIDHDIVELSNLQ